MTRWVTGLVAAGVLAFSLPAAAQHDPGAGAGAGGGAGGGAGAGAATPHASLSQAATTPDPETRPPRFGRNIEHSVGFRLWAFANLGVPEAGLFAHVEQWSMPVTVTAGPEYVYRRGALDIVVGIQYTGYGTDPGYVRGSNDADVALERIQSSLYAVYANALFLWHVRPNDWFEFQYGLGIGLGYVGGDLNRTQVYPSGGGYGECTGPLSPPAISSASRQPWCDNANNHFLNPTDGSRYTEPRLTSGGNVPPVLPWISLPHLAAHFRPHRNVDIRVDAGFAILGVYGGIAGHFVFN